MIDINDPRHPDNQYLSIANLIGFYGEDREDRTGTGTRSLFAPPEMRFDLTKGFPLLTTKKLHIPSIVHELVWFLSGSTDIKYLLENNINIWNDDAWRDASKKHTYREYSKEEFLKEAKERGYSLGPIYGQQWRDYEVYTRGGAEFSIDQIHELIKSIKENPNSRRHVVSAWNVGQIEKMALPPCHILFQAYVSNDGGLSLKMYQRSADWFLGVPFNIASYALLTHVIAQVTGLHAKELIMTFGDAHIYKNHFEQMDLQYEREARPLPTLVLNPDLKNIDDFKAEDVKFFGYDPHGLIKGKLSVGK